MRLQVIALATIATVILPRRIAADPTRAAALTTVYSSNDGLTVVSPQVSLRAPVHRDVDVVAGWEADVISAASVDVMTSASPHRYQEIRQGVTAGAIARPWSATTIGARWMPSWEPDYRSQTFVASIAREWIDRRLTTELGVRVAIDRVGKRDAPTSSWRALDTWGIDAGLAWVFSPSTVGQLLYEAQILDGYQASPYRLVRVGWPGLDPAFGVPENVPDLRVRHAFGVGLRHALGDGWFAATSARFYADSWSVASHTEEIELQRALLDDALVVGVDARAYEQTAASFYAPRYPEATGALPEYRTADKMLTRSWSLLAGARAALTLRAVGAFDRLQLYARFDVYEQRFFDFPALTWRRAFAPAIGLAAEL